MKLALIGQGYWGSKVADECTVLGIETDVFEIGSDLSTINPKQYFGAVIATPANDHVSTALKLLKNNNNLLIEKPIASDLNELETLKQAVQYQKIMVGHILIYNELYQECKKHIKDLQHIHTRRNAWGRFKKDISPILNLAPHDVAILDDMLQRDPISVYSHPVHVTNNPIADTVYCFMDYGDVQVTLELGWYNHDKVRETNFVCKDKHIVWNDVEKSITAKNLYLDEDKRQQNDGEVRLQIREESSPLQNQILAFQKYCRQGTLPITNLQHAERVTKIVDALETSYKTRQKIWI